MLRALDFDPDGDRLIDMAFRDPLAYARGGRLGDAALEETKSLMEARVLPNGGQDDAADAYRHALWSYRMAKALGPEKAKAVADAYERSHPDDKPAQRLMDLYNNKIGRELASDPSNSRVSDSDVVLRALRAGKLRVEPFKVRAPEGDYL